MFAGSFVALITPFKDGTVDVRRLAELVEFQIKNGTNGLVPCGTTGESVTMEEDEDQLVIRTVLEVANKRVPVIAGTGSNDTESAIGYTKMAQRLGADGALVVSPYYNKPTQEGLFRHYEAIAAKTDIPIVVYNVPGRTGVNVAPETFGRLAKLDSIVAAKEASGSMDQTSAIVQICGPDFDVLSGDDSLTLPLMALGAKGVISVVANVAPSPVAEMVAAFLRGDTVVAREIHYRLFELCRAMFIETNPIPVKTAAGLMGLCSPEMRLPLCPMSENNVEKLRGVMRSFGLLPVAASV